MATTNSDGFKYECTVPGCGRKGPYKKYCTRHYAQMRKKGRIIEYVQHELCTASGCEKKPRSTYAEYCETHYYRLRRTGKLELEPQPRVPDAECWVDGCESMASHVNGLCRNHHLGYKRNGDFEHHGYGPLNTNWLEDHELTYTAMHQRIRRSRGVAKSYQCTDCDSTAQHWSYDHNAEDERQGEIDGYIVPFSTSIHDYSPRCVPCHKKMDLEKVEEKER